MESMISFEDGPFPVASLTAGGGIHEVNTAWRAIAADGVHAWAALGLVGTDREDFADVVNAVAEDGAAAWLDVDAHVLAERRWARCHIWPSSVNGHVIVSVIPLRETRDIDRSREEIDHIERILEHTADAITILSEDMSFRFVSGIATRLLGVSGSAHEGRNALDVVFPDDHHVLVDAFTRCIEQPRLSIKARFRAVHESGDLIWVEGIGTNMFDDPLIQGILVTLNDITELVETRAAAEHARNALEIEKQRYEMLAQFTPTGVFELDVNDRLTFHNGRFAQLFNLDAATEFRWEFFDARDRSTLKTAFERARGGATTQSTVRLARSAPDAPQRWLTIRAVSQDKGRILGSAEDATTQIAKQVELAHRADHDDLTGLPNRESLLELLEEISVGSEPFALLFLDLDNFKDINDGLGHQAGDQVLIEIAGRIRSVVRPTDIVGRLHGDEFLVICRHTDDIRTARVIAARVVQIVSEPLEAAAQLVVSGSIGIAMNNDPGLPSRSPEQLLGAADVAMYEAKRRGGSRSVPFDPELGVRAADRLRLHGEVQRASEFDELEVHYQPIVALRTLQPVRQEALIRWHHPTQGIMLPERFIPEIERSELIDQVGWWIVQRVVADLALENGPRVPINVNVSARQLADESFATTTLDLLDTHGIDGDRLTIEITELTMMHDLPAVETQLLQLQRNGVGIAIDDFGTGYSALSYLQRFRFDQIKIDGVFVAAIDSSEQDQAIMGSLIELVRSLGSTPIAEKVERQSQVDALIELGCPLAQGFLLGRPEPLAASNLR